MAQSFMICFACHGKHCFANVYAYDTVPREYHVHILNSHLFSGLPEKIVLIEKNEKLCLLRSNAGLDGILASIEGAIRQHEQEG